MQSQTPEAANPAARTVIQGKLRPPPEPAGCVPRRRLEELLARLIESHRSVLVSATAGAGKTTAVAAAVRALDQRLAWLTLDWTDAAPGRLVTYLEAALARALPRLTGVATGALAARIPHPEATGLLAEAIGDEPVLLVIDELERLEDSADAWAVIEALLRYAPAGLRVVLISRRKVPLGQPLELVALPEPALAFTAEEAAAALAARGERGVDPVAAVESTGGWVTGVLFEAWRYDEHIAGAGGEADPLHGYLSAHIVRALPDEDCDFLVSTSVLDEVTAERAKALGSPDAAARLASLRHVHLPVVWGDGGRVLRCHPRFREYLLELLERRGVEEVCAVRRALGRLLAAEGRDEEAVEALLAGGAPAEALPIAERSIFAVLDRLDFDVADRWIQALRDVIGAGLSPLVIAELMLALAVEDFRRGAELADALAERGLRAHITPAAALLMVLCYAHTCRLDAMQAVVDETDPDATDANVLRYFMTIYGSNPPPPRPALTGGPLDALVLSIDYGFGRMAELVENHAGGWVRAWSQPWIISALSATGRTQQALELYEAMRARGLTSTSLDTSVGPYVLIDAGRREEALAAIERGRRAARAGGSVVYEELAGLAEARLALRLDRDPHTARAVLDRLEAREATSRLGYLTEQVDTWYGYALLLLGDDAGALRRLHRAVANMRRSERMHELPTAGVYLAEAEWRAGDEHAADRAADIALDAARRQGSNHMLLQALADLPAVVSRRLDAESAADSAWHELGRALIAQGIAVDASIGASIRLLEFGRCGLLVDGQEVRPRIAKSYELLAYLGSARPPWQAERDELLDALFEARADESTRAYLRQAVRWLRSVLPDDSVLVERGRIQVAVAIDTESCRFEAALAEAARLRGEDRLAATLAALEAFDRGEFLPGVSSQWVEERRQYLTELATDARYEAAELAFAAGQVEQARALVEDVLQADRHRETAWRLTMRLLSGLGDEDGVIRAYQQCERALAEIGATASPTTRQLLERLRR